MTRVQVLTPGFETPNGCAFLFPLIVHRHALAALGISVTLQRSDAEMNRLADCDVLILDSKFYSPRWTADSEAVLDRIAALAEAAPKLFYFDITDSSGWDHARALPHVTAYFKNQLLKDRSAYLRPLYGYRVYADHYHRSAGAEDPDGARSEPVAKPALLDKLYVGWNSALADYSLGGPARMALYRRLPVAPLLRFPADADDPARPRPHDLSCRFATGYARQSVGWQRQAMARRLGSRLNDDRVSRRRYLAELREAKIVPSPFGFGEICYRDFEAFLAGALVLKPDTSHMETWPDLYRDGETFVSHCWDLSDLEEKIEALLADDKGRIEIARHGQDSYRRHLVGREAAQLFAERFAAILRVGDETKAQAAG